MHHLSEWQIFTESKRMDESWKIHLIATLVGVFSLLLMYLFILGRKKNPPNFWSLFQLSASFFYLWKIHSFFKHAGEKILKYASKPNSLLFENNPCPENFSGEAVLYTGRIVCMEFKGADVVTTNGVIRITFLSSEKDLWVFWRTFLVFI